MNAEEAPVMPAQRCTNARRHCTRSTLAWKNLNNIPQYVYNLKATTQRVAVALRRASAKGVRALIRRLGHCPVVPSTAAGGAEPARGLARGLWPETFGSRATGRSSLAH